MKFIEVSLEASPTSDSNAQIIRFDSCADQSTIMANLCDKAKIVAQIEQLKLERIMNRIAKRITDSVIQSM